MMMSTSQGIPPLHVLRGILRRLKVQIDPIKNNNHAATNTNANTTSANKCCPIRKFVLNQYRAAKDEMTSPAKVQQWQRMAEEYYNLRNDITERSRLYQLDTGAEMQLSVKELSRRAAARAGLQLPDLNPDLEKDLK
jgi:hypothetical protein